MVSYGLSYFLEDMTGKLTGSEFVDIYGRMRLTFRRTTFDTTRAAYMIFNTTSSPSYSSPHATTKPLAALDFGPNNTLGTINFPPNVCIPMQKYLTKTSSGSPMENLNTLGPPAVRLQSKKLILISLPVTFYLVLGRPPLLNPAVEFLASLLIMRHIAAHNL
ncbi:hypothetical protein EYR38_006195 [Pleurotus pulmonarius]|nr:hypothetical protein EYR38_006195 [Pleurotus pulmonarius]